MDCWQLDATVGTVAKNLLCSKGRIYWLGVEKNPDMFWQGACSDVTFLTPSVRVSQLTSTGERVLFTSNFDKNNWYLNWIASSSYNNRNAKLQKHRGRELILGPAWSTCWHLFTQTPLSAIIRNRNYLSGSHLSPTASFMDFPISILAICACFSPSALAPKATLWIPS